MTGRTHDLAAFTALTYIIASYPLQQMSLGTALVAFSANMIGGLAPDLDQSTSKFWRRIRGGSFLGMMISPLIGGHRFLSHSLVGIVIAGMIAKALLELMSGFLIVDQEIVWWAFMIGYVSHLITDSFTREGVPWLFPIPISLGIPPLGFLRFKTGGLIEKSFVFPSLIFANAYLIYTHYAKFIDFVRNYIKY